MGVALQVLMFIGSVAYQIYQQKKMEKEMDKRKGSDFTIKGEVGSLSVPYGKVALHGVRTFLRTSGVYHHSNIVTWSGTKTRTPARPAGTWADDFYSTYMAPNYREASKYVKPTGSLLWYKSNSILAAGQAWVYDTTPSGSYIRVFLPAEAFRSGLPFFEDYVYLYTGGRPRDEGEEDYGYIPPYNYNGNTTIGHANRRENQQVAYEVIWGGQIVHSGRGKLMPGNILQADDTTTYQVGPMKAHPVVQGYESLFQNQNQFARDPRVGSEPHQSDYRFAVSRAVSSLSREAFSKSFSLGLNHSFSPGNNEMLYTQQALAAARLSEIAYAEVDGSPWNKKEFGYGQRLHYYLGGSVSDSMSTNNGVPSSNVFTGIPYLAAAFRYNRDEPQYNGEPDVRTFAKGVPVREVEYKNGVYSLSPNYKYSNNSALVLLDYLTNRTYGRGIPLNKIDLPSFYRGMLISNRIIAADLPFGGRVNAVPYAEWDAAYETVGPRNPIVVDNPENWTDSALNYPFSAGSLLYDHRHAEEKYHAYRYRGGTPDPWRGLIWSVDSKTVSRVRGKKFRFAVTLSSPTGLGYPATKFKLRAAIRVNGVNQTPKVSVETVDAGVQEIAFVFELPTNANTLSVAIVPDTTSKVGFAISRASIDRGVGNLTLHTFNGTLDTANTVRDNIKTILYSMPHAELPWSSGKYKLVVPDVHGATPQAREQALQALVDPFHVFTEHDIIRDSVTVSWPDQSERLNQLTVQFKNEFQDFKDDTVKWPEETSEVYKTYLKEDNGILLRDTASPDHISDPYQALAYAEGRVRHSRATFNVELKLDRKGLLLEPGDFIRIEKNSYGIPDRPLKVIRSEVNEQLEVEVEAYYMDPEALAHNVADHIAYTRIKTVSYKVPQPVNVKLILPEENRTAARTSGVITWQMAKAGMYRYEVGVYNTKTRNIVLLGTTADDRFELPPMTVRGTSFYVRAVNSNGTTSAWAVASSMYSRNETVFNLDPPIFDAIVPIYVDGNGNSSYVRTPDTVKVGTVVTTVERKKEIASNPSVPVVEVVDPASLIADFDITPPPVPTNLAVTSTSSKDGWSKVVATWDPVTTALGFDVDIKEGTGNYVSFSAGTNTYEWELRAGTPITVRVRSRSNVGQSSAYSAEVTHTVAVDTIAPVTPTNFAGQSGFGTVWLTWANNTEDDLSHYEVYESDTTTPVPVLATAPTYTAVSNTLAISGLGEGVTKHYWLRAVDFSGNKSPWTTRLAQTTTSLWQPADAPAVPTGLTLTTSLTNSAAEVSASWTASANAISYELGVVENSGNEIVFSVGDVNYKFAATRGSVYTIRVRGVNQIGSKSSWSATETITASVDTVPPANPTGLVVTAGFGALWVRWNQNTDSDLSHYEVYMSTTTTAPTVNTIPTMQITGTTATVTGLGNSITRYFWLRAVDTSGNKSGWTARVTGKTLAKEAVTTAELQGLVNETSFANGLEPISVVAGSTLPITKSTTMISFDGRLYRWDGTVYKPVANTDDLKFDNLTGSIDLGQIPDQLLTRAKLSTTLDNFILDQGQTALADKIAAEQAAIQASEAVQLAQGKVDLAEQAKVAAEQAKQDAVDEALAASNSAGAAAGHATTASDWADEAGQSAGAAAASATAAETQAGYALASQQSAAQSVIDAEGFKNQASLSSTVAASTLATNQKLLATPKVLFPSIPEVELMNFTTAISGGDPIGTINNATLYGVDVDGKYIRAPWNFPNGWIAPRGIAPLSSAPKAYRITIRFKSDEPQRGRLHFAFLNSDGTSIIRRTHNISGVSNPFPADTVNTWSTVVSNVEGGIVTTALSFLAEWTTAPQVQFQFDVGTTTTTEPTRLYEFLVEDVTEVNEAAKYATASATSSSEAEVAKTDAGVQASAALQHKTDAEAAAGNASTYAGQASQARDDAEGFAGSASLASGAAVEAKDDAEAAVIAATEQVQLAAAEVTAAGAHAEASQIARTAAELAQGAAETAVIQASQAKQDAEGFAGQASTSQIASASTLTSMQKALANSPAILSVIPTPELDAFGLTHGGLPSNYSTVSAAAYGSDTDGPYVQRSGAGTNSILALRGIVPSIIGNVYRVSIKLKSSHARPLQIRAIFVNADGTSASSNVPAVDVPAGQVVTLTRIVGRNSGGLVESTVGTIANWENAVGIRFAVYHSEAIADSDYKVYSITVEDLTQADRAVREVVTGIDGMALERTMTGNPPATFEPGLLHWTMNRYGDPATVPRPLSARVNYVVDPQYGPCVEYNMNASAADNLVTRALLRTDRRWRYTITFKVMSTDPGYTINPNIVLTAVNADYLTGPYASINFQNNLVADDEITWSGVIAREPFFGVTDVISLWGDAPYFRGGVRTNVNSPRNGVIRIKEIRFEDVTEQLEAAAYAAASASSASTAEVEQTAAGVHAQAAFDHRTAAETASTNASTFATQASEAKEDAEGFKVDAETALGAAVQAKDDAEGYSTAASGFATTASAHKDDAEEAVNAANLILVDVQGFASDAEIYRGQAAQAVTDAEGHKANALEYSNLAASSSRAAAASAKGNLLTQGTFEQDDDVSNWSGYGGPVTVEAVPSPHPQGWTKALHHVDGNELIHYESAITLTETEGIRHFRFAGWSYNLGTNSVAVGLRAIRRDDGTSKWLTAGDRIETPSGGPAWQYFDRTIDVDPALYSQVFLRFNSGNSTIRDCYWVDLWFQDITSETRAAVSATAAANSASTAETKAGEASTSATAASDSLLSARVVSAQLFPAEIGDGSFWTTSGIGDPKTVTTLAGDATLLDPSGFAYFSSTNPKAFSFFGLGVKRLTEGQVYRITVSARARGSIPAEMLLNGFFHLLNDDYTHSGWQLAGPPILPSALDTWELLQTEYTIPAQHNGKLARIGFRKDVNLPAGTYIDVRSILIENITNLKASIQQTQLALSYADAAGEAVLAAQDEVIKAEGQAGLAISAAGDAAGYVSDAEGHSISASNYAKLASLALSGGVAKNPTFSDWVGTSPNNWGGMTNGSSGTTTKATGKYGNAVEVNITDVAGNGPTPELRSIDGHMTGSSNPEKVLVTVEAELLEGSANGCIISVNWYNGGWYRQYFPLGSKLTTTSGIQTHQVIAIRSPSFANADRYEVRILTSVDNSTTGSTRSIGKFRIHRVDAQEILADSFVDQQMATKATVDGLTSSSYVMRVKAGGAAAGFEMVAASDPSGAASSIRMSADEILLDGTVKAAHMTAGSINTRELAAGAITASKLAVSDATNLIADSEFQDPAAWGTTHSSVNLYPNSSIVGAPSKGELRFNTNNTNVNVWDNATTFAVTPGDSLYMSCYLHREGGTMHAFRMRVIWKDAADATVGGVFQIYPSGVSAADTFHFYETTGTVPANAVRGRVEFYKWGPSTDGTLRVFAPTIRLRNKGQMIVDGSLKANHLVTNEVVISETAQIKDAIITNAKITELSAAKLTAGTALASTITVSGTALSDIRDNAATGAQDPATRINSGNTTIDPGKIVIQGSTSLADWRAGPDKTTINGGVIEANTIRAGSLEIGSRALGITGIVFEHNSPAVNQVSWTAGSIGYVADNNAFVASAIAAGSATWTSGTLYIYWTKGGSVLNTATNAGFMLDPDNVVIAVYAGDTNLDIMYGKTIIDGSNIKTGTIDATRLSSSELITNTAQIKDGIITNAKISELSAAKLTAGTALASTITVSGTALSDIRSNAATGAQDPATRINSGSTTIDPGKIVIQGATTLADWKAGPDSTEINGGKISANSITANKLEIGSRNVTLTGIQFTPNSPGNNQVSWTAGQIRYINDSGAITTRNISAGNATWSSGVRYIYWVKDATSFSNHTSLSTAMGVNNLIVATYQGGSQLDADLGRTIIDGDSIKTGSIASNHISANVVTASKLAIADFTNLVPDSELQDPDVWHLPAGVTHNALTSITNAPSPGELVFANTGVNISALQTNANFITTPGELYACFHSHRAGGTTHDVRMEIDFFNSANVKVGSTVRVISESNLPAGTIHKHESSFTIPAEAVRCRVGWWRNGVTNGVVRVFAPTVRRKASAELIVDGAITTAKLEAGAVTAGTLATNAVTAAKIAANAVTTDKIAANSITADKIVLGTSKNLISNPGFWDGTNGWFLYPNDSNTTLAVRAAGTTWAHPAGPTLQVQQTGAASNTAIVSWRPFYSTAGDRSKGVPCVANEWYGASAKISAHRTGAYCFLEFLDLNGDLISSHVSNTVTSAGSSVDPNKWEQVWVKGQAPANASHVKVNFMKKERTSGTDSVMFLWQPMLEISNSTATGPSVYDPGQATLIGPESIMADRVVVRETLQLGNNIVNLPASSQGFNVDSVSINYVVTGVAGETYPVYLFGFTNHPGAQVDLTLKVNNNNVAVEGRQGGSSVIGRVVWLGPGTHSLQFSKTSGPSNQIILLMAIGMKR